MRAEAQRKIQEMENCWWVENARETQAFADNNSMQGFFNALKTVYGPRKNSLCPVQSADGSTIYKDKTEILNRWAEHLKALLNHQNPYDEQLLNGLPNLPVIYDLKRPPQMHELIRAVNSLKEN